MNNARPLPNAAGVVPLYIATWHNPAMMASVPMRAIRLSGKRNNPCQPRIHSAEKRPRLFFRLILIHGRLRLRSWLSWRRNNVTVRRSCRVTAKRNCVTSAERRDNASSDWRAKSASPTAINSAATADGMSSLNCVRSPQSARPP